MSGQFCTFAMFLVRIKILPNQGWGTSAIVIPLKWKVSIIILFLNLSSISQIVHLPYGYHPERR